MNENNEDMKLVRKRLHLYSKTLIIFITSIVLICFFIFIFNYDVALDDYSDGGFVPPSFVIVIYYFFLSIIAIIAAIIIKIRLKDEASLSFLLTFAIIIPIFCYNINRQTLKENGAFHFLVDEGGIFHFIAIKDFNFDGINDEEYHRLYDTRTVRSGNGGSATDKIIKMITTEATGVGRNLGGFTSYNEKDRQISLHLHKNDVVYEKIEMIIEFYDPNDIKSFSMSLISKNQFGQMDPLIYQIHCEYQTNEDNTLSLILDAEDCLTIQKTQKMNISK